MTDKKQTAADRVADSLVRQMRQLLLCSLAALTGFAVFGLPQTFAASDTGLNERKRTELLKSNEPKGTSIFNQIPMLR